MNTSALNSKTEEYPIQLGSHQLLTTNKVKYIYNII